MNVLVVVPAYNEEENIRVVIGNLREWCPYHDYVIVNDGSRDNTTAVCREEQFNLLDLPVNLGLAGALQLGMQYASINGYDAVLQFDGDGQHEAKYIDDLCQAMKEEDADIVIGSRFLVNKKPFSLRMAGSRLLQLLIRVVTRVKLSDPTSGMRLFGIKVVEEFAWRLNYGPEPDTLVYLMRNGVKVVETPVSMHDRLSGESYLSFTKSILYMLHMVVSILFIQWFRRRK